MKKSEKRSVGRPKKKKERPKKPVKAIIIDFGGIVPKARFINTTDTFFRGSDLDKAYKAMRKGLIQYKKKIMAKLEGEQNG